MNVLDSWRSKWTSAQVSFSILNNVFNNQLLVYNPKLVIKCDHTKSPFLLQKSEFFCKNKNIISWNLILFMRNSLRVYKLSTSSKSCIISFFAIEAVCCLTFWIRKFRLFWYIFWFYFLKSIFDLLTLNWFRNSFWHLTRDGPRKFHELVWAPYRPLNALFQFLLWLFLVYGRISYV